MKKPTPLCKHCHKKKANRPRGLCWTCYYDLPGVRDLYPSGNVHCEGPGPDFNGPAPLPERPTRHAPGTSEKLDVLQKRASRGEALFHHQDAAPAPVTDFDVPTFIRAHWCAPGGLT